METKIKNFVNGSPHERVNDHINLRLLSFDSKLKKKKYTPQVKRLCFAPQHRKATCLEERTWRRGRGEFIESLFLLPKLCSSQMLVNGHQLLLVMVKSHLIYVKYNFRLCIQKTFLNIIKANICFANVSFYSLL